MERKIIEIMPEHSCGSCTACCEGWLSGEAHGVAFFRGRPCNFVTDTGCSIYAERPEDPCKTFSCEWLNTKTMPMWMRPDKAKVILIRRQIDGTEYVVMREAGEKVDSAVLSWVLQAYIANGTNVAYEVNGGMNYFGTREFVEKVSKL
jgi:hypothetical protein